MALLYNAASPLFQGQNIRPPLGTFFNGQSYQLTLYPELGRADRSVLVIKMILQFQFSDGDSKWTDAEKNAYCHTFVDSVIEVWNEKFRITTTSKIPAENCRDVGVVFNFPYYIDGWHTDDDFEISVKKVPADKFEHSSCQYNMGNSYLHTESIKPWNKGATMMQRPAVHEFGHMLGLRDEYVVANDNMNHTGDKDSIMHFGELVRVRHYAPFAAWLSDHYKGMSSKDPAVYKVSGTTDLSNAQL